MSDYSLSKSGRSLSSITLFRHACEYGVIHDSLPFRWMCDTGREQTARQPVAAGKPAATRAVTLAPALSRQCEGRRSPPPRMPAGLMQHAVPLNRSSRAGQSSSPYPTKRCNTMQRKAASSKPAVHVTAGRTHPKHAHEPCVRSCIRARGRPAPHSARDLLLTCFVSTRLSTAHPHQIRHNTHSSRDLFTGSFMPTIGYFDRFGCEAAAASFDP